MNDDNRTTAGIESQESTLFDQQPGVDRLLAHIVTFAERGINLNVTIL